MTSLTLQLSAGGGRRPWKTFPTSFPLLPVCPGEFQSFAMSHPEYAKLFTTYLELQRYQAIQEADPGALQLSGQTASEQEDSVSDKKDD